MITSFPSSRAYNPGGYIGFKFIPVISISSFPAAADHVISEEIEITLESWYEGYSTSETLSFKEPLIKSDHGENYRPEVSGFIPGENDELASLIFQLERARYFVLQLTSPRGKIRIIGSPENPLEFSSNFASGDQRSDAKGFTYKFTGNALDRAPFYQV